MENKTYTAYDAIKVGNTNHRVVAKKDNPSEHIMIEKESDIDDLIDLLRSMKTKMTIEQYLDQTEYNWKKLFEFVRDNARYLIYEEINPSGDQIEVHVLFEQDGNIYNDDNQIIVQGGVILPEGYVLDEIIDAGIESLLPSEGSKKQEE